MTSSHIGIKTVSALKEPAFRRFFYAIISSTLAVWLVRFLIGWLAWSLTESAFWVGGISAAMMLPTLILSPVFGVVSDRINPKNGMIFTAIGNALICFAIALALWWDQLDIRILMAVAFAFGCVTAAQAPMRLATVPQLVKRDQLPSAIGITAITFNTARILGPAAGAVLLTLLPAEWIFVIAAGLFLIAMWVIQSVALVKRATTTAPQSLFRDLVDGLAVITQHQGIKMVLLLTFVNGVVARTVMELLPAVAGLMADGTAKSLATLTASAGIGSILGGLVVSQQSGRDRTLLRLLLGALIGSELVLLSLNWASGLWALIPIIAAASLLMTIAGTCSQALLQMTVNDDYRGRVMSIWTVVAMGSPALGALATGALADWMGIERVISASALIALAVTLYLSRSRNQLFQ